MDRQADTLPDGADTCPPGLLSPYSPPARFRPLPTPSRNTTCCSGAAMSSIAKKRDQRRSRRRHQGRQDRRRRRELDPADAVKVVDVDGPVRHARPDRHPRPRLHRHRRARTRTPATTASTPTASRFRVGVTTVADAGGSGWRNFEDFKDAVIDRVEDPRARLPQHRRQRHARRQVRAATWPTWRRSRRPRWRKHTASIVGIKTAHYTGPGMDAGRARRRGRHRSPTSR